MTTDVAARMEQVLGQPPRMEPIAVGALGEGEREVIQRLRALTNYPPEKPVHSFFTTLAHQPTMFEAYMELGISAMGSASLPLRERELLILRTSWLCGAPYPFGEHVVTGKAAAGLSDDDIARVKQGSGAEGWSEQDRSLLKAAEELHADAMISDETWAALAWLPPGELIELLMIVGHYHMTAFLQNSLRFGLNEDRHGLEAR